MRKLSRQSMGYIYQSCDGHCYYCGVKLDPFGKWDIDHMTPLLKGGEDTFYNYVLACQSCNRRKGCRTVEEFRAIILHRALTHANAALQTVIGLKDEPGTHLTEALNLITNGVTELTQSDIIFFGEATCLPRGDDDLFCGEFDHDMYDIPDTDETYEAPIN